MLLKSLQTGIKAYSGQEIPRKIKITSIQFYFSMTVLIKVRLG